DPLRRHEAFARPRRRGPRGRPAVGSGKAALPEPGPDPADPRPVDRQVHRAPGLGARRPQVRTGGVGMTTKTEAAVTTQVFQVFIKATPQAIWDAITSPEWTQKYGYKAPSEYELRPGGKYRGLATEQMKAEGASDVLVDGEVIEADPPHKLVQTWR